MRHVDEGLLHAYIDGAFEAGGEERREIEAHLGACADCRVRLEDARRIRGIAQDVLDAASPVAADVPAFETVVAEHARRRSGVSATGGVGVPAPRPRIPLAWAATVVLALGAGWMARAMIAERGLAPEPAAFETTSLAPQSEEAADAVQPPESEVGRSVAQSQNAADAVLPAESELRRSGAQAPAPAGARPDAAAAVAQPERQELQAAKAAAPPPAVVADADTALRALSPRLRAGITLDEVVVTGAAAFAPATWIEADSATVAEALSAEPVRVEGMAPDTLQLSTVAGKTQARSVYILPAGVVELIQQPAGAGLQDRVEEAGPEADTVLVVRGIEVQVSGTSPEVVQGVIGRLR